MNDITPTKERRLPRREFLNDAKMKSMKSRVPGKADLARIIHEGPATAL